MVTEKPSAKMLENVVETARAAFNSGRTRPVEFRKAQLRSLLRMYEENSSAFFDALKTDLRRNNQECALLEMDLLTNDLRNVLANLDGWTKPTSPSKSLAYVLDKAYVIKEPYGVVLVLGAWNYPFQLSLIPFAAALAAGNCIVLKPSEVASASAQVIAELLPKYVDGDCYQVVMGGPEHASLLLEQRFDFIFFTGSTHVGKLVHAAAAKHLTPTVLELGGKSPVYLDDSADIRVATRRILWGKWINAGQTCIAPDYLLCSKSVQDAFVAEARKVLDEWYGNDPRGSPDFCRIINGRNFERITGFLGDGTAAYGGKFASEDRFVQMTILVDVARDSPVMREEIFGPILPIINVGNIREAIDFINQREKPLALYVFSNKTKEVELILRSTSSGGSCVNDTVMHYGCEALPFGGVGNSGMGFYHGKYGFEAFSHQKSCLYKNLGALGEKLSSGRYPPYSQSKTAFIQMLMKKRTGIRIPFLSHVVVFAAGVAITFLCKAIYDKYNNRV